MWNRTSLLQDLLKTYSHVELKNPNIYSHLHKFNRFYQKHATQVTTVIWDLELIYCKQTNHTNAHTHITKANIFVNQLFKMRANKKVKIIFGKLILLCQISSQGHHVYCLVGKSTQPSSFTCTQFILCSHAFQEHHYWTMRFLQWDFCGQKGSNPSRFTEDNFYYCMEGNCTNIFKEVLRNLWANGKVWRSKTLYWK